jgi:hypothetical protein
VPKGHGINVHTIVVGAGLVIKAPASVVQDLVLIVTRYDEAIGIDAANGLVDDPAPGDDGLGRRSGTVRKTADLVAPIDSEQVLMKGSNGFSRSPGKRGTAFDHLRVSKEVTVPLPLGPEYTAIHPAYKEGRLGIDVTVLAQPEQVDQPLEHQSIIVTRLRLKVLPAEEEPDAVEAERSDHLQVVLNLTRWLALPELHAARGGPIVDAHRHKTMALA